MQIDNTYILTIAVTISLIFLGLIKKNSAILFYLQLLWMYILAAGNTLSIDMGVHKNIFESAVTDNIDTLYGYFCYTFYQLGLDFIDMNAILCIFLFAIIAVIIKIYSKNPCFVMSLLYIYPLVDYIIQKRFFTAFTIVLLGIVLFLFRKGYIYILAYILIVLLAAKIHSSAYIYMLFLLAPIIENSSRKKILFIMFFIIIVIAIPFLPDLVSIIDEDKSSWYFNDLHEKIKYPILNTILWGGFHIGFVYLYYRIYLIIKNSSLYSRQYVFAKHVLYINICSLFFIPLYAWEPTFFRFYRNLLVLNYISISMILPITQVYLKETLYETFVYFIYVVIAFICIYFYASAGYEAIIHPILYNNFFLDIFRM